MILQDELISKNKNNYSLIYSFSAPNSGVYDIELTSSKADVNSYCYLYADIDTNLNILIKKGRNILDLTKESDSTGARDFKKTIHGSFYLEENNQYYLKVAFLKKGGMYTYNLKSIKLVPNSDQSKKTYDMGYTIYQFDFNSKSCYPYYEYWAKSPNYINITNEFAEFYYNQEKYDANFGKREFKGAELTGEFTTVKDGWYGYKVYFTDNYPKNANTTIITQIFNQGRANTWAGHLHTKNQILYFGYRGSAAVNAEVDVSLGEIEWNVWYNIVIYFKVGKNNKGNIKVWISQGELVESEPKFDSGGINFGFGTWVDDETLDNTVIESNGKTSQIVCKFGLYTWDGGDKIIRFKNFTALEYNPNRAFDIVNPS